MISHCKESHASLTKQFGERKDPYTTGTLIIFQSKYKRLLPPLSLSLSLLSSFFSQLDAKASLWRLRQKRFEVTEEEICADRTKVAACTHHLQVRGVVEAVVMETIELAARSVC